MRFKKPTHPKTFGSQIRVRCWEYVWYRSTWKDTGHTIPAQAGSPTSGRPPRPKGYPRDDYDGGDGDYDDDDYNDYYYNDCYPWGIPWVELSNLTCEVLLHGELNYNLRGDVVFAETMLPDFFFYGSQKERTMHVGACPSNSDWYAMSPGVQVLQVSKYMRGCQSTCAACYSLNLGTCCL